MSAAVAIRKTAPESVIEDYGHLLREAGYAQVIKPDHNTILKVNLSWDLWFPACSTAPWQLEGVARALIDAGIDPARLIVVDSGGAGIKPRWGERNNGLAVAADRAGLGITRLEEPSVKWVRYEPKVELPLLQSLCKDGIFIPDFYQGSNIIHLPVMKTHSRAVIAGAIENISGGLVRKNDCLMSVPIADLLVDLLALQQELHPGVLAVADGVFCGDGPGPRALRPYGKGYIIAGADPVAVDAVIARMMGFDPMSIGYIRAAHERGLGCGEIGEIDITGEGIAGINFQFGRTRGNLAGRLAAAGSPLPAGLAKSYLDYFWYPYFGWSHLNQMAETRWGQLLQSYLPEDAVLDRQGHGKGYLAGMAATGLVGLAALRRVGRSRRRR